MSSPFDVKVAETTTFAPRQKGKELNKREQMLAYVHNHGWVLDTTATIVRRRGETVQDPLAFTRPAADGGTWHLSLDYKVADSWTYRTDNILRGLVLRHSLREGEKRAQKFELVNTGQKEYDPDRLWAITGRNTESLNMVDAQLRRRAERVIADPDLVAWLSLEQRHKDHEEMVAAQAKREAYWAKRRARNEALTVDNEEFSRLARHIRDALYPLSNIDGTTDVAAAMAELDEKVAALKAAVKEEGK